MARFLEAALALAWKDLLRFSRQPFLVVVSVVMPLMFILFYAIIVPSSATAPVVVAMEDDSPLAQQFVQALRAIHSREAPYYELVTTDPEQARRMFANAEAFGMIVIPTTFDAQVEAGTAQVELHIRNINSDYSKNLALRLDDAVRTFAERSGSPTFTIEETSTFAQDPTMADYISTSLLLFGCLYSAMLNTGLHIASEWNDRTIKTLLLAPTSRSALITGKVLAGVLQSLVSVALILLLLVLAFGFNPVGSLWALAAIVFVVLLLGAGLGALAGVASKQTLAVTSILITASIFIFLVSGNEDSLRGLAWDGPVTGLWWLARVLPTTYAFLAARSLLLTGDVTTLWRDLAIVLGTTIVTLGGVALLLRRAYSQLPGGQ
jgi:ABC-type Na+ efflux pump permease subunit